MGILDKIKKIILKINKTYSNIEILKYQLGELRANSKTESITEFKVFSQWGEDGVIQYLINNINISSKKFIEFGVEDYTEANTRFLLMHDMWEGLVIDGGDANINSIQNSELYWRYRLTAVQAFITAENINTIIRDNGFSGPIGILSVDIDGNDYWVWKAIDCVEPDIVICEYNYRFGKDRAVTIPYKEDFVRGKAHYSHIYYGASIRALVKLGEAKGYSLVYGNKNGNNIFFVRNDLLNEKVKKITVEEAYHVGSFRESRDQNGKLNFLNLMQEREIISQLPIVEV